MQKLLSILLVLTVSMTGFTQDKDAIIQKIMDETYNHSQLEQNAYELLDRIGPRLVGTPEMKQAHDWAVNKYKSYDIMAENQEWGKWKGWQRGTTHIDLVSPRSKTLVGMQLAWSPATKAKGVTAEVVILPEVKDSVSFQKWLSGVKGKLVMVGMNQPTGRPDYNWEKWATPESFNRMKKEREELRAAWNENLSKTGYVNSRGTYNKRLLIQALEDAGAVGIIDCYWSNGFGTNKIFGASTKKIPMIDMELEDYSTTYRMAENGDKPTIHLTVNSKDLGEMPTFNTIAQIKGTEKPEEYVILSAHFDSWDGGTGATDNGTGTILMMEVMRILKKVYPNPKRTILVGHWGSEEQGLNGSAAFVEDHPEIVKNIQAVFNQDNGTGRVENINGGGLLHSYRFLGNWLAAVPDTVSKIETNFPGSPATGGSDHASFAAAGAPAFGLSSMSWDYGTYTWHTNRDTYDKIVWEDLRNNVILTAVLTYMASEDEETTSREQIVLPVNKSTGEPRAWPNPRTPNRNGGQ